MFSSPNLWEIQADGYNCLGFQQFPTPQKLGKSPDHWNPLHHRFAAEGVTPIARQRVAQKIHLHLSHGDGGHHGDHGDHRATNFTVRFTSSLTLETSPQQGLLEAVSLFRAHVIPSKEMNIDQIYNSVAGW